MYTKNSIANASGKRTSEICFQKEADVNKSHDIDPSKAVTLSWRDINAFVKPKKRILGCSNQNDVSTCKQLLHNVSGEAKPGQLLAIMGSSGAGKTTLLNILANRNLSKLNVDGEILVNGQIVGESIVLFYAYVRQDDLFIGTLTVREHLIFQALLRMDRDTSYEDRLKRVEEVIVELGLKECENTAIGIAGKVTGISGGEAKRLAFASELITNPSLMFCDEPTSGLDSFMSRSVVSVLREMARGGRTIVCVIHQPSSEVYELFDHLLLMADGRVAYKGESSKALEFFERAGLRCPVNYSPADFFIDSLAIDPGNEAQCREKVMTLYNQFTKEQIGLEINSFVIVPFMDEQLKPLTRYKASWWAQFRAVIWRSWISLIREPLLIKVRLGQSVLVALIFGVIYLNQKVDEKGVMNINGVNFFILMNLAFQNLFCVINAFVGEQPLFLREHWNGMYRTDVYFLSKSIVEAPFLILASFLFVVITYWMIGLNPDPSAFINNAIIHTLIINTSASFGYMISCVSDSLNVALSLASPMLLPLVLFGGFYLNEGSIPVYFVWLKYISWFYYGNEALAINQWANIKNITCETQQCPSDGTTVLKMLNFHEENYVRDIVAVVALLVFIRVLAFILLLLKSSTKT